VNGVTFPPQKLCIVYFPGKSIVSEIILENVVSDYVLKSKIVEKFLVGSRFFYCITFTCELVFDILFIYNY